MYTTSSIYRTPFKMGLGDTYRELSRLASRHKLLSLGMILGTVYVITYPLCFKTPMIPVASKRIEEAKRKVAKENNK